MASFLLGATFNVMAMDGENPFSKIWQAISNLQGRVENIEESMNGASEVDEFINEISRVELLRTQPMLRENRTSGELITIGYEYDYGVSGIWNVSKIQTEPIIGKLNSLLGGFDSIAVGSYFGSPFENQGYERGITVNVYGDRELSEAETETVRVLIQDYLAYP